MSIAWDEHVTYPAQAKVTVTVDFHSMQKKESQKAADQFGAGADENVCMIQTNLAMMKLLVRMSSASNADIPCCSFNGLQARQSTAP